MGDTAISIYVLKAYLAIGFGLLANKQLLDFEGLLGEIGEARGFVVLFTPTLEFAEGSVEVSL